MTSNLVSRLLRFQDRSRASLTMVGSLIALSGCSEVTFTDLESTGASEPPTYSWAQDVNDNGLVVGGVSELGPFHPVKFVGGAAVALPIPPSATDCSVRAVGNGGEIVGDCFVGLTRGYLWKPDGTIVTLGDYILPTDVNSAGVVVGIRAQGPSNAAVVYDPTVGEVVVLPMPAETRGSLAIGINDAGDIVGQADTDKVGGIAYSVIWSGAERKMKALPRLNDCGGQATAINNHGLIGGRACSVPVLWQTADSLPEQLSAPPLNPATGYVEVVDMNDRGEVIGQVVPSAPTFPAGMGWTIDRKRVDFILTTLGGINNSGVTVGSLNGRAVQIDWL